MGFSPQEAYVVHNFSVSFWNGDIRLAGRVFRNTDRLDERQPAIIVTGSWLTVKEQMPAVYAPLLAERGYTVLTFDFGGFGQSAGEPRQAEIPHRKIGDLCAAADFVRTLSGIDQQHVVHLAICASAQYGLAALARGSRIDRFISVAGWYHDAASVAPFYGGAEGVAQRLAIASAATDRYNTSGTVEMVPAYKPGDPAAGMSFELDYYASASRGAIPAWKNSMATMSWWYWLTFDGLSAASQVETPSLFVHSDGCVLPDNLRRVYSDVAGPKRLEWSEGGQTDFYDQPAQVARVVELTEAFLENRTV